MDKDWREFNYAEWKQEDDKYDHATFDSKLEAAIKGAKDLPDLIERMRDVPPRPPWHPNTHYDEDGDMVEVFLNNESYYAIWLNPQLTVFVSHETDEIVGMSIHGVKRMMQEARERAAKYEMPEV